eukprot:167779_1
MMAEPLNCENKEYDSMDEQRQYNYIEEDKEEDDDKYSGEEDSDDEIDKVTNVDVFDHDNYYLVSSPLDPNSDENVIKILAISDTHNLHKRIKNLPKADILIHTGDFSDNGKLKSIKSYNKWISKLINEKKLFKYSILIAGNHDVTLDEEFYNKTAYCWGKKQDFKQCKQLVRNGNFIYLEDNAVTLFGITFYGSPYQPEFCEWAFQLNRGDELKKKWTEIPEKGIDILLTHGPPKCHGDLVGDVDYDEYQFSGCNDLLNRVKEIKDIKYHIFGHVHEGYGVTKHDGINTVFINASTVNRDYEVVNKPIMFYVKGNRTNNE